MLALKKCRQVMLMLVVEMIHHCLLSHPALETPKD
jgi:hypothetical protein